MGLINLIAKSFVSLKFIQHSYAIAIGSALDNFDNLRMKTSFQLRYLTVFTSNVNVGKFGLSQKKEVSTEIRKRVAKDHISDCD
jgi:hypothetical protein